VTSCSLVEVCLLNMVGRSRLFISILMCVHGLSQEVFLAVIWKTRTHVIVQVIIKRTSINIFRNCNTG
jgi:hypothetical protein